MTKEDIQYGELLSTVKTLVIEQQESKIELKKLHDITLENNLWVQDQKKFQTQIKSIGVKKVADFVQYAATFVILAFIASQKF